MSDDINVSLGIEPDDQSAGRVKRLVDQVERQFKQFTDEIKQGAGRLSDFFKGPSRNKLKDELKETEEAAKKTEEALKKTKEAGDKTGASGGKGVDVRGSSGTISTAAGAFGSVTGQGGLTQLGDIASLTEQASALGEVFEGLGPKFSGLATVAPVAGVAVAAVAGAVALYNETVKDQTEATRQFIAAQQEITSLLMSGAGSEEAAETIRRTQEEIKFKQDELALLDERYNSTYGDLNAIQKVFNEGEEELYQRRKALEEEIGTLTATEQELTAAREAGRFAANDAAQAALDQAASDAELYQLQLEMTNATRDEISARLQAIEVREAVLERELRSLEASGDVSQEVTQRMGELRDEMVNLDAQTQVLNEAIQTVADTAQEAAEAILSEAAEKGDLVELELQAAAATREANEAKLKSIEIQKAGLIAELEALRASGNTSAEVAKRMQTLQKEMSNLDKQTGILANAIKNAGNAAQEASKKSGKSSSSIRASSLSTTRAVTSQAQQQQQAIRDAAKAQAAALEKAYEDQKRHQQRLQDLTEDFYRQQEDAQFEGDFRRLFQLTDNYASDVRRLNRDSGVVSINNSTSDNRQATFNFPQGSVTPGQVQQMIDKSINTIVIN